MVIADAKNFQNVDEFSNRNSYFFSTSEDYSDVGTAIFRINSDMINFSAVLDTFSKVPESKWDQENLTIEMNGICERLVNKSEVDNSDGVEVVSLRDCKRLVQLFLRAAIAKGRHGPGIIQTMVLIGRHTCRKRLLHVRSVIKSASP